MRAPILASIVVIILLIAGGAWHFMSTRTPINTGNPPVPEGQVPSPGQLAPMPSGAAGIKGSPNQGNLGQPSTNSVQMPGADGAEGSVVGSNLVLGVNGSKTLGNYLIAYNGMTLYMYTKDTAKESTCYEQCATNWPPYVIGPEDNVANVKEGVDSKKVGTITRTDGKIQVTYDGHPLYFWTKDTQSGDASGQDIGKAWYVVKP
jgi:predicted lipoprotein with Yx(FWY)xxD motif